MIDLGIFSEPFDKGGEAKYDMEKYRNFEVYDLTQVRGGFKVVGSSFSRGPGPGSRETFLDIEHSDGSVECNVKWSGSGHNDGLGADGSDTHF